MINVAKSGEKCMRNVAKREEKGVPNFGSICTGTQLKQVLPVPEFHGKPSINCVSRKVSLESKGTGCHNAHIAHQVRIELQPYE